MYRWAPIALRSYVAATLLTLASLALPLRASAQTEVLSNQSVLQLVAAGVEPSLIIQSIESSRSHFTFGVNDVVALSHAHVPQTVVASMRASLARGGQPAGGTTPAALDVSLPTEYGVYVVSGGEATPLPASGVSIRESRDRQGHVQRSVVFAEHDVAKSLTLLEPQPVFLVYLQDVANSRRIHLFHLNGMITEAYLGEEIPLRQGPVARNPQMARVIPDRALDRGTYVIITGDDYSRGYGFARGDGQVGPPLVSAANARNRAAASPAVHAALAPAAAIELVKQVLARRHITTDGDFQNGFLLTPRQVHSTGLFGGVVSAVQFAVLVQPSGDGSDIRVGADAYGSGSSNGMLSPAALDQTPLIVSPEMSQRQAEWLSKEIQKALERPGH